MATSSLQLRLFTSLFFVAALSSFTLVHCEDSSSKQEEPSIERHSSSEETSNERTKRSQEEVLFGNQQNKPSGLVDDVMGMAEEDGDVLEPLALPLKKSNDSEEHQSDEEKSDNKAASSEDDKSEDKRSADTLQSHDMMMGSGANNWFSTIPISAARSMQYLSDSPPINSLQGFGPADAFRRKRELRGLRSSLGGMIHKRGARLPRRSMRLKRQLDVDDLLHLFGGERVYDQEPQVAPRIFGGRAQTVAKKRRVPSHFSSYPETPYPYVFRHRDDGVLSSDADNDGLEDDSSDEIDNLMLLPPSTRFSDSPDIKITSPFRGREEENDAIQDWLSRHTTPSVFRVARRSSPFFYPLDYRFIQPGLKKRSSFRNGPSFPEEPDLGQWGRVVAVPEAFAAPEDVARLYGLAGLMAEGDDRHSA